MSVGQNVLFYRCIKSTLTSIITGKSTELPKHVELRMYPQITLGEVDGLFAVAHSQIRKNPYGQISFSDLELYSDNTRKS